MRKQGRQRVVVLGPSGIIAEEIGNELDALLH